MVSLPKTEMKKNLTTPIKKKNSNTSSSRKSVPSFYVGRIFLYKGQLGLSKNDPNRKYVPLGGTCLVVEESSSKKWLKVLINNRFFHINSYYIKAEVEQVIPDNPIGNLKNILGELSTLSGITETDNHAEVRYKITELQRELRCVIAAFEKKEEEEQE